MSEWLRAYVQVSLLNAEHSPDLMLLAARAITFLADVMPSACSAIVRHGAVPAFCARLMTIEYIDLAEQSLQVRQPAPWTAWLQMPVSLKCVLLR